MIIVLKQHAPADGIIDLIPHAVELFAEGFDLVQRAQRQGVSDQ